MKSIVFLSIGAVVVSIATGCGGSSQTSQDAVEQSTYNNVILTKNADSSYTLADGQQSFAFKTLKYEGKQADSFATTPQGTSAQVAAACKCDACHCNGTSTCTCTGCSGDTCPP